MDLHVPYRSYEEIEQRACSFLDAYHPSRSIPIPIDEIVECDLELNLIPVQGLRDVADAEGFLTGDMTTMYVDATVMDRYPPRFRFTLAHEVAHLYLHAEYLRALAAITIQQWKASVLARPTDEHKRLEFQANEFAGRILVPRKPLLSAVDDLFNKADQAGAHAAMMTAEGVDRACSVLAARFAVSARVVRVRLEREGILTEGRWQ